MRLSLVIGAGLCLLGLDSACVAQNSLFDDTRGAEGGGTDTPTTTTATSAGSGTSQGPGTATATSSTTTPPGTTAGDHSTSSTSFAESGVGTGDTDTEPPGCSIPKAFEFGFAVTDGTGKQILPDCEGPALQTELGPLSLVDDTTIRSDNCGQCGCKGPPADSVVVELAAGVVLPQLPDCGRLHVWTENVGGACEYVGLSVYAAGDDIPSFIAAQTLVLPAQLGNGEIGWIDVEPCPSDTCDTAGHKSLTFFGTEVSLEGGVVSVQFPFAGTPSYDVINLASFIDEECVEHVAWRAELEP